jgi:hypothetical protein
VLTGKGLWLIGREVAKVTSLSLTGKIATYIEADLIPILFWYSLYGRGLLFYQCSKTMYLFDKYFIFIITEK